MKWFQGYCENVLGIFPNSILAKELLPFWNQEDLVEGQGGGTW